MNIQRFILPASVAAALHVALLWAIPPEDYVRIVMVPLGPADPPPRRPDDDPVVLPPETRERDAAPVVPLAGGPTPPEIPDALVTPKPGVLEIPLEARPVRPTKEIRTIPNVSGPGTEGTGPGGPVGVPIFKAVDLDRIPNAKVQIAPDYPFALKHEGASGSVLVEFEVDRNGQVSTARVVRSSRCEFEEPTLRAVLKWRFEPGKRDGRAVPFRMTVPVEFSVEN